jgi:hypothetical protein
MNKKLMGLAVMFVLAATLGACNSGGGEGGSSPSPAESPSVAPS